MEREARDYPPLLIGETYGFPCADDFGKHVIECTTGPIKNGVVIKVSNEECQKRFFYRINDFHTVQEVAIGDTIVEFDWSKRRFCIRSYDVCDFNDNGDIIFAEAINELFFEPDILPGIVDSCDSYNVLEI